VVDELRHEYRIGRGEGLIVFRVGREAEFLGFGAEIDGRGGGRFEFAFFDVVVVVVVERSRRRYVSRRGERGRRRGAGEQARGSANERGGRRHCLFFICNARYRFSSSGKNEVFEMEKKNVIKREKAGAKENNSTSKKRNDKYGINDHGLALVGLRRRLYRRVRGRGEDRGE
jgi:hypothetical protein